MDFSFSSLLAGFIFGVIGFYLFKWGKQKQAALPVVIGIVLMVYPYFISNVWLMWLIGVGLCFTAYRAR